MASSQAPVSKPLIGTLSELDPIAKALVERLVLFHPDSIPLALLEPCHRDEKMFNGPDGEFPMLNECLTDKFPTRESIDEAISTLYRSCLVTQHSESKALRFDNNVRDYLLNSFDAKSFDAKSFSILFDQAIFALNAQFPKPINKALSTEDLKPWHIYCPHLISLIKSYDRFASSLRPPVLLCEIIRRCSWYFAADSRFNEALAGAKKACEILELAVKSNNHPGYSRCYMDRLAAQFYVMNGISEYELNLPGHGRPWYEKAQFILKQVIDNATTEPLDLKVMALRNGHLALASLAEMGPADSDMEPVDSAIASFEYTFDSFDDANSRVLWACNLSMAYRLKGMLDESWKWCEIANTWILKGEGDDSLSMAILYCCSGNILLAQKKEEKAFVAFEQCLLIRVRNISSHRFTGYISHKIGLLMRAMGYLDTAILYLKQAIKILDGCEGQAGAAIRSKSVLSSVLMEQGKFDAAEAIKKKVTEGLKGLGDPMTAEGLTKEYLDRYVLFCHR